MGWTDLGAVAGANTVFTLSYLGNGIVIAGASNGHIYRNDVPYKLDEVRGVVSTDLKSQLCGVLAPYSINYKDVGGNIGLVNSGWADLGAISTGFVLTTSYFGNGIAIAGDLAGHICRSIDYGKSWLDLGDIAGVNSVRTSSYIGNGIAIFGDTAGHIWRSTDFGVTWTDLGAIVGAVTVRSSQYLGNGIVIVGTSGGHI